jgi:hypothetical protein
MAFAFAVVTPNFGDIKSGGGIGLRGAIWCRRGCLGRGGSGGVGAGSGGSWSSGLTSSSLVEGPFDTDCMFERCFDGEELDFR